MAELIFDGDGAVFGRMASEASKSLLKGDSVSIVNCEEIIVSGRKEDFTDEIKRKRAMGRGGSLKGPKYVRSEDLLVKRLVRGMLPWDRKRGREVFRKLKCYIGKGPFTDGDLKEIRKFNHHKKPLRYFKIKEAVRGLR